MVAIETIALEKTYPVGFWRKKNRLALHSLSLQVLSGEVFGFLGPNGAGKTTTLKLLTGLIFPTAGSAKILGMNVDDPRVKAQIGYSPEQPYFYDYLTASELLHYMAELSAVPSRERSQRIEAVLRRTGLHDVGKLQLRKFSKGMLQRLSIAQAILHSPEILFLDEPMSGLDPMGRREVRDLIQELKDSGRTIFFSTHILADAEVLCDRVAVMNKGELRGIGTVAELKSRSAGVSEVQWTGALGALQVFGGEIHVTGNMSRAVVNHDQVDAAIDIIRSAQGRVSAVIPLRATLEDYFLEKVSATAEQEVR